MVFYHKKSGFTLVELSIVLVVIGLLVGGVLVGQELIRAATRAAAVKQVNDYRTAAATYLVKYGAMPGDDPRASQFFSDAFSGDGDGKIYTSTLAIPPRCMHSVAKASASAKNELIAYWDTMAMAGLINYTYVAGSTQKDNLPEFKLAKDTYVEATCIDRADDYGSTPTIGTLFGPGHIYILGVSGSTMSRIVYQLPGVQTNVGTQIPAGDAFAFDSKMDDGIPNKGRIKVLIGCDYNNATYTANDTTCLSTLAYKWD